MKYVYALPFKAMALCWRRDTALLQIMEFEPHAGTEFHTIGSLCSGRTLDPTKAVRHVVMCVTCCGDKKKKASGIFLQQDTPQALSMDWRPQATRMRRVLGCHLLRSEIHPCSIITFLVIILDVTLHGDFLVRPHQCLPALSPAGLLFTQHSSALSPGLRPA